MLHQGRLYSVNAILARSWSKPVLLVPLVQLDIAPLEDLDYARVLRADDRIPIILLEKELTILDGMHRAAHARLKGRKKIAARLLTADELEMTRY